VPGDDSWPAGRFDRRRNARPSRRRRSFRSVDRLDTGSEHDAEAGRFVTLRILGWLDTVAAGAARRA
jgi:hypothetical protein